MSFLLFPLEHTIRLGAKKLRDIRRQQESVRSLSVLVSFSHDPDRWLNAWVPVCMMWIVLRLCHPSSLSPTGNRLLT